MMVARTVAAEHDGVMGAYAYVLERLREDDYRRLRGYLHDGRSTFSTWLAVVARRMCVDHYRRRYGRPPRGEGDASAGREERATRRRLFDLSRATRDLIAITDDRGPTPDDAVRIAQRNQALARAIDDLDPADRVLLKLRFEDDLSARDIATVLQMPSAFHVYRRLATVFASLRRRLAARGVESSVP
jgi:RNA polymerase sigma factor (sigma-70 family)